MVANLYVYYADGTDPYRNIATEKLLLESVQPDCCILYLWQNKNTVVIGRNQNAWAECRTSLLEQEGGHLARRLSGGGAVFHDLGNLNFTFLVQQDNYDLDRQLSVIEVACGFAGISVERSGRNDLLAQGCKFSGNAFYHAQGRAYHHGTLLVDSDMDKLGRYLTPPKAKLEAKGVASVRSRVINLRQLSPELTCERMAQHMAKAFGQVYGAEVKTLSLSPAHLETIETYTQNLQQWQWLYGQKLPFSVECTQRFQWGSISLQLQAESGQIKSVQVYSDAMDWTLSDQVSAALTGCRFNLQSVTDALTKNLQDTQVCTDICTLLEQQAL